MLRDRFSQPLDSAAAALSGSTDEDVALLPHDLWGSLVHARMLGARGIIPPAASRRIQAGLRRLAATARDGRLRLDPRLEDVHLNVEAALTRAIGRDGERLHTARSRNDQVATDLRLFERDAAIALELGCAALASALVEAARGPGGRGVVDGWTHLQPAQRVYWAQLLGSHALRGVRDGERFAEVRRRADRSPLGSGALAGTSLPIDRAATARGLGFVGPTPSSIDAVSDRDVSAELLFAVALLHVHLSQLAEELVLGAMPGIDRVRLSDAYVTTSSLMPHKRNPDLAELARAQAGPALGRLVALMGVLKGLPIGYQRDLQAGKPLVIEAVRVARLHLEVVRGMVASAELRSPPVGPDSSTASVELADALVVQGVPFRSAHARVARWLAELGRDGRGLGQVAATELASAFPELEGTGFTLPGPDDEVERRVSAGGSSWRSVAALLSGVQRRAAGLRWAAVRERGRLLRLRRAVGAFEPDWLTGAATRRPVPRPRRGRRTVGRATAARSMRGR